MKPKYHFLGAATLIGGLTAYNLMGEPDKEIPIDHTGDVTLSCHGEAYQVAINDQGRTLMDDTRQQTRDVTLKIDFNRGRVVSWRLATQSTESLEDGRPASQLEQAYNSLCSVRSEDCIPVQNQDGSYELYRYSYMADDVILKGTSIMSPDLKLFAGYQEIDDKAYANAMSCKITAVYNPFTI